MNDGFHYALDAAVQHFSRDEAAKPVEPWQMTPDQLRSLDADSDSPLRQYARWHTTAQRFGKPGSQVPVFRSVSDGDESNAISPGNWVSANEDYAKNYGGKSSRIIKLSVDGSHLVDAQTGETKGDTLIYAPPHERVVADAIAAGHAVPDHVMAAYPHLKRPATEMSRSVIGLFPSLAESEFARKKPVAGQKGFDFGDDEPPAAPIASGSGGFDEHKVNREHEAHDGKRPGEFAPKETPEAKPEESEAEGPLWYGMKHRPPSPGAIPVAAQFPSLADDHPKEEAKPAEPEVWHKGDRVRMTGKTTKDAGATFHEAEYLEGHRKGQKTMILDQGEKDVRSAQNQQDWKDQQAGFAKLHKSQNPEPAAAKTAENQSTGSIYETQVRGGDGKPTTMYGVASRPNGEPGFVDSVFRTREEAQSHLVKKAELDKANSEFLAKQNAAKEKEAAREAAEKSEREDINGFSEDASPRDKANIIKTLSKKASFDGKVMSLKDKVRELVENGESPTSHETNKIQPMTRTQFNRADQRQQDAHEKKMREAGTKTVYRVGGYDLGKTAHDYAKHLISQKSSAAAVAEQFPSLKDDIKPVAEKAEPTATPWHADRPEVFEAMRNLNDKVSREWEKARDLAPRGGTIGVGGADFDHTLKASVGEEYLRTIRKGGTPAEALAAAEKAGRDSVKAWNEKTSKGRASIGRNSELKRWEGAGDSHALGFHQAFNGLDKKPEPPESQQKKTASTKPKSFADINETHTAPIVEAMKSGDKATATKLFDSLMKSTKAKDYEATMMAQRLRKDAGMEKPPSAKPAKSPELDEIAKKSESSEDFIGKIKEGTPESGVGGLMQKVYDWAESTPENARKFKHVGWFGIAGEYWRQAKHGHEFSRSDHGCRANLISAIHSCLNQDGKHKADESVDTQIPEDPAQLDPHVAQVLQALAGQDPDVKEALGEYLASCAG